jgi:hypothetical protein
MCCDFGGRRLVAWRDRQEASQKLLDRQGPWTLLVVVCGVAPSEGDL